MITLTETQLETITAKDDPLDVLLATWEQILGYPLGESEEQVDPTKHTLPTIQTKLILARMLECNPDNRMEPMMLWLNNGPSSRD